MTPAALERLRSGAAGILGHGLTDNSSQQFGKYLDLLVKWQKRHRLVGSTDAGWIVDNLFLDSLLFLRVLPSGVRSIVDVGSGAGFPAYPLKIVKPEIRIALVESRHTRSSFLRAVARELSLDGVTVWSERAESLDPSFHERPDAVVLRCAGNLSRILPTAAKLVRSGGIVVASGPPTARKLDIGEWVVVDGVAPGRKRRFAIYHRP